MELMESQPLLEWLANNYKSFGATLEIITDKSQEGSQFVRGFGGIGGTQQILLLFHFLTLTLVISGMFQVFYVTKSTCKVYKVMSRWTNKFSTTMITKRRNTTRTSEKKH